GVCQLTDYNCWLIGACMNLSEKQIVLLATLLIVALTGFTQYAYSQTETGRITGTVFDPTGAVIPNAKVTVKSVAMGLERQTTTTSAGTYAVTNLQPGRYTVRAEASGFAAAEQLADVTVGARVGLDLRMTVGGISATVEVTEAPAGLINTETQTLSQTVTGQEVLL